MLPNEFKARLIMLDLTHAQYADIIGITERTLTRWLNEATIPKYGLLSLECLEWRYKDINS